MNAGPGDSTVLDAARSAEALRWHYDVETRLASQLRSADKADRKHLYSDLYDELFRLVPDHPQLQNKLSPEQKLRSVRQLLSTIERFLNQSSVVLEIGPGDCALSFEMSKHAAHVYGVDVSSEITKYSQYPNNFELILSDGTSIPLPDRSIDLVFSNQLMEHLHPEDAIEQLSEVFRVLKPGGLYICITPSQLTGPHDISSLFDDVATGFHLKEYTYTDLRLLFREIGFRQLRANISIRDLRFSSLLIAPLAFEWALRMLPAKLARRLGASLPLRPFVDQVALIGAKPKTGKTG